MTTPNPDPIVTTTAALAAALLRSPLWPLLAVGRHTITLRIEKSAEGLAYLEPTEVVALPTAALSPDCRDGKHRACRGDAWSKELDAPTACACYCHERTSAVTTSQPTLPPRVAAA